MIFTKLLIFRSESGYTYISRTLRHKKHSYSVVKFTLNSSVKCYWDVWENSEVYYKSHIGSNIHYQVSPYKILIRPVASYETPTLSPVQRLSAPDETERVDEE